MPELPVPPAREPESVRFPTPHIGGFVLETMTLGMYGEPRHTLREYVQNSFDAIRAAQRTGFLEDRGVVEITLTPAEIIIRDNGSGVPADRAWRTLTSVGASKKDRQRDAGFRGIGRLAGMAYCQELVFRTTFPREPIVTTISFDCEKLLKAMSPDEGGDVELSKLLARSIKIEQIEDDAEIENHFFEVILRGLENAPETLTDAGKVSSYLSETVPVDFAPDWPWREQIEAEYKTYFGAPLETIDLFLSANGSTSQITKPYGNVYAHAKGTMALRSVEFIAGENNQYWGWIGRMSESAAVVDWQTRGLRVRVRNIQVDGTEIFEKIFTDVKPSYGRFSSYYVGEIHVDPEQVVPNARRDGFEETAEWIDIKSSLANNVCQPLASDAYEASQKGQVGVSKVVDEIDKLIERGRALSDNPRSSYDQVVDLMNSAKRLRRRAASALKVVGDLDEVVVDSGSPDLQKATSLRDAARNVETVESQARMMIGRFLEEDEKLKALKARLRQEMLQELLDVVNLYVDSGTYQKIKRHLTRTT